MPLRVSPNYVNWGKMKPLRPETPVLSGRTDWEGYRAWLERKHEDERHEMGDDEWKRMINEKARSLEEYGEYKPEAIEVERELLERWERDTEKARDDIREGFDRAEKEIEERIERGRR